MKSKTIVIFGGSGFLGKEIVSSLSSKGYILKVYGRSYEKLTKLKLFGYPGQISIFVGSINKFENIGDIIRGCDYVINQCHNSLKEDIFLIDKLIFVRFFY